SHIGSTGLTNRIMGISSTEASKFFVPLDCTKDCRWSSQKFVKMSARISSRVRCQASSGPESDRFWARRKARSKATQQIKLSEEIPLRHRVLPKYLHLGVASFWLATPACVE